MFFRNILFPTDFTAHARSALKYAAAFAREGGGRVVLFSVQPGNVPANLMTLPRRVFEEQDSNWLLQLRAEVSELLTDPLFDGLEVEPVIVEGEPEEIIAEAPCPVLTLRPPQHDFVEHHNHETEIRLHRILLATNFRPSSIAATQRARELAAITKAELHAIYVIGDYFEQISVMFPEGGRTALSRLRAEVTDHMQSLVNDGGLQIKTHIAEGRPYAEIVRLAARIDADLIVLGKTVHASLFGGAPALGSEIERVVRNAPCPVLCVPSGKVF